MNETLSPPLNGFIIIFVYALLKLKGDFYSMIFKADFLWDPRPANIAPQINSHRGNWILSFYYIAVPGRLVRSLLKGFTSSFP